MREAIETVLLTNPRLENFLFDFSEPYKIVSERFMLANYKFNVGIEHFAALTGRSIASFKRDFMKMFADTPGRWLLNTRLKEAHYQIQKNNKRPSTIFVEVWFESFAHFSNAFKAKYGYSPKTIASYV
ncbi:AraC family transcriptional regulator [Sphingobacterium oryzagri]|uniref:AraC family transcriptional regulator n=1 Tax=Sphingobacterium oryzagri TaxID=3025669 RepID=A0ABY7WCN0_9SPHI|nr:AraC family transcriptional regulator [Sphingobacterium sp. KACC 22765]WDF66953.1 AraC family transcriptional regulator [Sphingobacterium sp. KACC 22765]